MLVVGGGGTLLETPPPHEGLLKSPGSNGLVPLYHLPEPLFLLRCVSSSVCGLPAGGLISGGGAMGTMTGRLGVELRARPRGSGTPFLGRDWELLAPSGEASPRSDGGILGSRFSRGGGGAR